ncbi:MAG: hypothetical protein FH756_13940 [Firmicutes bacterium]|nr:hypothetical protein [Bacillota bacterium]
MRWDEVLEPGLIKRREQILNLVNSAEFRELVSYYSHRSFFNILNISRKETVHSDFLLWFFHPDGNHELGEYPLKKLLEALTIPINRSQKTNKAEKFPEELEDIVISGNYSLKDTHIEREKNTGNGFVDIYIETQLLLYQNPEETRKIKIIIENKVKSKEGDKQTDRYYEWAKKMDLIDGAYSIFVFLTPLNNTDFEQLSEPECKCKHYIQLNYQYMVDYIIEPCKKKKSPQETEFLIDNYLRTLSFPALQTEINESERGDIVMAIGERERHLLRNFWESHKELLIATFTALKDDPEISKEDRDKIDNGLSVVIKAGSKDNTKYSFNGGIYPKNRLVLEVIKKYVKDNPMITYDEIIKVFPDEIQGTRFGVMKKSAVAQDIFDSSGIARHFIKEDELIQIADAEIAVCNQWGIIKGNEYNSNISKFIRKAKELGYIIEY